MKKSGKTYPILFFISLFALLFVLHACGMADSPILWNDLQPGPHDVGFITIEKYDYTRSFRAKFDYFGNLQEGERARPIQICVWYPAKVSSDVSRMVLGEYVFPNPGNGEFFDFVSNIQGLELRFLGGLLGGQGPMLDVMNLRMGAVRDAEPDSGSFPLIIYFPASGHSFSDNSVICEYLAGNGYVVATTHCFGTTTINSSLDAGDMETMIRDKEFVYGVIRDYPNVDINRLGLFGYGSGGTMALLMQMRNPDVEAVVCLDGTFTDSTYFDFTKRNPYFNITGMHVPMLQMCTADNNFSPELFESLKYSHRYSLVFNKIPDVNFTHYGLINAQVQDSINPSRDVINRTYKTLSRYTLNFFNAYLKQSETSRKFIDSQPIEFGYEPEFVTYSTFDRMDLPPTYAQFVSIIRQRGAAETKSVYDKFQQLDPGSITFPEATFNSIGYQFLQAGRVDDAIIIFEMNTVAYPNSANCWDSFADAFNAVGDTVNALNCYRKVLEVLPNDPSTNEELKQVIRTNAENALAGADEGGE